MAAILRDSVVAVAAVVRTRPRAIQLAVITMRNSIHGFPSVFYMGMGLRLAALAGFIVCRGLLENNTRANFFSKGHRSYIIY